MKKILLFFFAFALIIQISCSSNSSSSSTTIGDNTDDETVENLWLKEIPLESNAVSNVDGCYKVGDFIYFFISYPENFKSVLYKVNAINAEASSKTIENYVFLETQKDDLNNIVCMAKTSQNRYSILILSLEGEIEREIPLEENEEYSPCIEIFDNEKIVYSKKGNPNCTLYCINYDGHKIWEKDITQNILENSDSPFPENNLYSPEIFDLGKDLDNNIVLSCHLFWNVDPIYDKKDEGASIVKMDLNGNKIWARPYFYKYSDEVVPYYHYLAFCTNDNSYITLISQCDRLETSPCNAMPKLRLYYSDGNFTSSDYGIYTLCPIPETENNSFVELHTMREEEYSDNYVCKIRQWTYDGYINWVKTLKEFDKYQNLKDFRTINSLLIKDVYQNIEYFFVLKTDTAKLIIVKCDNEGNIEKI